MRTRPGFVLTALVLLLGFLGALPARSQCILANPSFEIGGSGGAVCGGWNQFGSVGAVPDAYHGLRAARVSGPDNGGWDVSGYWQTQDCVPGERWAVTGHVRHPATAPLDGQSTAIVNVEWRDALGDLIDYQSVAVADADSPLDEFLEFAFVSDPAPTGTVLTLLLLAVLQSPSDPPPDVHYDQVTFTSTTTPTVDDLQWSDFPGGRTLDFGGRTWRVKGPGYYGPGPNLFCDDAGCAWVDGTGQLHLKLQRRGNAWYCTEIVTEEALGYGDYVLTTVGRLDLLDPAVVMGIFLWEYGPCWDPGYLWWNAFNEIDIEYSRWGDPGRDLGQFVAQPYDWPGNIERFAPTFAAGEVTSHAMRWLPDRVEYRAWRGGPDDESPANLIHAWTYAGPHIPRPEQPRLHLNLWLHDGVPAADQEIVCRDFTFVPAAGVSAVADDGARRPFAAPAGRLHPAAPNPFNPGTTIRFDLVRDGHVSLDVLDLTGRRVRSLVDARLAAGAHRATWDGRDDGGRAQASGVYLFHLRGEDYVETRRAVLVK